MAHWFRISPRGCGAVLLTSAVAVAVAGFAGSRAEAAAGSPFLAHQALYELKLVKSRGTELDQRRARPHSLQFLRQRLRGLHLRFPPGLAS